jgi:hypothetical protein
MTLRGRGMPTMSNKGSLEPPRVDSFDNCSDVPASPVREPSVSTPRSNQRRFPPQQAPATVPAQEHRFGARYSWPVEPGRRPTSRAASKRVAAYWGFLSFAAANRAASDGWRIFGRVGRAASCRCRLSVAVRTVPSAHWIGWFRCFATTSATRAKFPSSCRAIPSSNGSGFFCRRTEPPWMGMPKSGRQLTGFMGEGPPPTKLWRRDGSTRAEAIDRALSASRHQPGQPRRYRCL